MKQLAYGAYATVGQVVDVVTGAEAVTQTKVVVRNRDYIVESDVLINKLVHGRPDCKLKLRVVAAELVKQLFEVGIVYLFKYAELLGIAVHKSLEVYGVVANHLKLAGFAFCVNVFEIRLVYGVVLYLYTLFLADNLALNREYLARHGTYDVLCKPVARKTGADGKLFVVFVASYSCEVVTLVIVEGVVNKHVGAFNRRHLARTQTAEKIYLALLLRLAVVVLFTGFDYHLVAAEKVYNLLVGTDAQRAKQRGCGNLSRSVNVNPLNIVNVLLVFKPSSAVGDDRGRITRHTVLIKHLVVVNARASDQLAYDNALGSVDNE